MQYETVESFRAVGSHGQVYIPVSRTLPQSQLIFCAVLLGSAHDLKTIATLHSPIVP
jgi:hypothetical protein